MNTNYTFGNLTISLESIKIDNKVTVKFETQKGSYIIYTSKSGKIKIYNETTKQWIS